MKKKFFLLKLLMPITIAFLLLVFGTIYDLSISKALCILPNNEYYCSNFFVAICEIFGEAPLFILLIIAFSIIFNYAKKTIKNKKTIRFCILIVSCLLGAGVSLLFLFKLVSYSENYVSDGFKSFLTFPQTKVIIVILGLILEFSIFDAFKNKGEEELSKLLKWAIIVLCICAISSGVVKFVKIVFKRMRYRAMLYVDDAEFSYFTNWFQINKKTFHSLVSFGEDFFKSFPSGHASASATLFCLCLLPKYVEKLNTKKWKNIFLISSLVFTFVVCLTRIIAGAHFLTDVLIGAFITIILIFVLEFLVEKIFKKLQTKKAWNNSSLF